MIISPLPSIKYLGECFDIDSTCSSGLRWKNRPDYHNENINKYNKKYNKKEAGRVSKGGYYNIDLDGKTYRAHRILYALYHNVNIDEALIDHKDGDKLNNSIYNLREATPQQNQWNSGLSKNNKSGYKGIKEKKLKNGKSSYCVRVMVNFQTYNLGTFRVLEDAIKTHTDFVNFHHGIFSKPNNSQNEQNISLKGLIPFAFSVY